MDSGKKFVNSFIISASIAVIFIVAVTIMGELYAPLKDWLKNAFTHHWIGKGAISFIGFYLISFLLYSAMSENINRTVLLLNILTCIVGAGIIAIIGFYYYEAFLVIH